jgi:hypothetical protein
MQYHVKLHHGSIPLLTGYSGLLNLPQLHIPQTAQISGLIFQKDGVPPHFGNAINSAASVPFPEWLLAPIPCLLQTPNLSPRCTSFRALPRIQWKSEQCYELVTKNYTSNQYCITQQERTDLDWTGTQLQHIYSCQQHSHQALVAAFILKRLLLSNERENLLHQQRT